MKTAGVDDHQVGAAVLLAGFVTFGAQLGKDQFGVGQRFGTAETKKATVGGFSTTVQHRSSRDLRASRAAALKRCFLAPGNPITRRRRSAPPRAEECQGVTLWTITSPDPTTKFVSVLT
jgi:hypothetical protein